MAFSQYVCVREGVSVPAHPHRLFNQQASHATFTFIGQNLILS